jgi:pantothenate synthetase
MKSVETASADSVAIVAARVGPTRLIDNMILGDGT